MADTYSQIYIHLVFAVQGRYNLIQKEWKDRLYKYISKIVSSKNQKLFAINGPGNHIHLLISLRPDCNLSELVRDIKANSSRWINEQKLVTGNFNWQKGYGAFSLGHSQLGKIIPYIQNQEEHHRVKTFREEYIGFLKAYGIEYKHEYIFMEVDEKES
jgi:REP element-mobilizing transposase RayT